MSNPLPSHGLKNRYSIDLSRYTWLLRINSMSRGSSRKTKRRGPIHILMTSWNRSPHLRKVLKMTATINRRRQSKACELVVGVNKKNRHRSSPAQYHSITLNCFLSREPHGETGLNSWENTRVMYIMWELIENKKFFVFFSFAMFISLRDLKGGARWVWRHLRGQCSL